MIQTTKKIDSIASKVQFNSRLLGLFNVPGTFTGMNGTIQFNPEDLKEASFEVCVDASSIDTGIKPRNEHLKAEDFLDVANHPKICFHSKEILETSEGFVAIGNLSLAGTEREVRFPFTFKENEFAGNITIQRTEFNVGKLPTFAVGNAIDISISCVVE